MQDTVRIIVNRYVRVVDNTHVIGYDRLVHLAHQQTVHRPLVTYDIPGGEIGVLEYAQSIRLVGGTIFTVNY